MWYYCYVLESTIDKTTSIGSTDNLINRLKEHNSGKTKSIQHKNPYEVSLL